MPLPCTRGWWFYCLPERVSSYLTFDGKSWKNLVEITSNGAVSEKAKSAHQPKHLQENLIKGQARSHTFCLFQVSPVLFRALNIRRNLQAWTCQCLGCNSRRNVIFCSLFRGGKTLIENDMVKEINFRPKEIWEQTLITSILTTSLGPVLVPLWMGETQEDWISHF